MEVWSGGQCASFRSDDSTKAIRADAEQLFGGASYSFGPLPNLSLLNSYLFHCPSRAVALNDDVVRHGVDLVDQAGTLAVPKAGLRPAEQLSIVVQPVEFSRAITAVNVLG